MISSIRKIYMAITLFCARHMMAGKSTLLSLLYCAKTSNVRKVCIAIKFVLSDGIQHQENLHVNHFLLLLPLRHSMLRKIALQSHSCCAKTFNVEKTYFYHNYILQRHPMPGKSTLRSLLYLQRHPMSRKSALLSLLCCANYKDS